MSNEMGRAVICVLHAACGVYRGAGPRGLSLFFVFSFFTKYPSIGLLCNAWCKGTFLCSWFILTRGSIPTLNKMEIFSHKRQKRRLFET